MPLREACRARLRFEPRSPDLGVTMTPHHWISSSLTSLMLPSAVQKSIHVVSRTMLEGTQLESTEKLDVRLAVAQHVRDITRLHDKGGNCSCKCPEGVIDLLSTSQRSSVQVSEEAFDQNRGQSVHIYNGGRVSIIIT